jgi:hypothetical protein
MKRERNMAITYQSEIKDGLLVITASGRDENLQEVIDYGCSVLDLAIKSDTKLILCDERNLEYALNAFDTLRAAQTIAERAPKVFRAAIVCGPKFLKDGKFWETVAVNRSLQVRVDTDMDRAREWLLQAGS